MIFGEIAAEKPRGILPINLQFSEHDWSNDLFMKPNAHKLLHTKRRFDNFQSKLLKRWTYETRA
ncbi:hypothetical protein CAB17_15020 [Legionella sainthelensi]|uniref:Uncharacterized protein n=1 Tax=Legionella sainthelensi TaxID=28087 RepID=A0A2H5FNR7_9GAMM|nr:hypothetical protein CAB17_15020 [Legionella sainthelensi]